MNAGRVLLGDAGVLQPQALALLLPEFGFGVGQIFGKFANPIVGGGDLGLRITQAFLQLFTVLQRRREVLFASAASSKLAQAKSILQPIDLRVWDLCSGCRFLGQLADERRRGTHRRAGRLADFQGNVDLLALAAVSEGAVAELFLVERHLLRLLAAIGDGQGGRGSSPYGKRRAVPANLQLAPGIGHTQFGRGRRWRCGGRRGKACQFGEP